MPSRCELLMGSVGAALAFSLRAHEKSPDKAGIQELLEEKVKAGR